MLPVFKKADINVMFSLNSTYMFSNWIALQKKRKGMIKMHIVIETWIMMC